MKAKRVDEEPEVGCGNTSVHQKSPISLPPEFIKLNKKLSQEDIMKIETETRKQHESGDWFRHREGRLTASNFGKVLHRKIKPTESFVNSLFHKNSISSPAMDYGRKHEKDGKVKYLETFPSRHIHECGLVIINEFNFLGASPDGKVCDNGETGILEVKCPYSARNLTIEEACALRGFYVKKNGNIMNLNTNHNYYAQIQGQLMITGCKFCDFVVYTQKSIFVERILPNVDYMKNMLQKLCTFMMEYGNKNNE